MSSLEELQNRSVSDSELVLPYIDAMNAINVLEKEGEIILGWEGWLVYPNGSKTHSLRFQGTSDLDKLSKQERINLAKSTITQAHTEWQEEPEVVDAKLYFCITFGT